MKSLFERDTVLEIEHRLDLLTSNAEHQWGKMTASQMLAHNAATLEMAMGRNNPPRSLLGRLIGPFVKGIYSNEKPITKNMPTDPSLFMSGEKDFDTERNRLKKLIQEFAAGGETGVTKRPHSFFGKLTPMEWAKGMYKHLDHHLKQFGV